MDLEERTDNKTENVVRITEAGKAYCEKVSAISHGKKIRQCQCFPKKSESGALISHGQLHKT